MSTTSCSSPIFLIIFLFLLFILYISTLNYNHSIITFSSHPTDNQQASLTHVTHHVNKKKSSVEKIEEDLGRARAAIWRAIRSRNYTSYKEDQNFIPSGSIYRNSYAFHQLSFTIYMLLLFYSLYCNNTSKIWIVF
ncbi:hypothetical protein H5410_060342 [Solanum commersonii]|uniref:Transmembrane protein n=1 Tax=Solanum commersonii TaxID=4109 RepID=A0A9J5W5R9_SOLCO|nr:hypothetical protein H5410_060342 [Solanum commersonii]